MIKDTGRYVRASERPLEFFALIPDDMGCVVGAPTASAVEISQHLAKQVEDANGCSGEQAIN